MRLLFNNSKNIIELKDKKRIIAKIYFDGFIDSNMQKSKNFVTNNIEKIKKLYLTNKKSIDIINYIIY